jgi:hypothetical protein
MKLFSFVLLGLASCTQDFGAFEIKSDAAAPSDGASDAMMQVDGGCSGTIYMGHCYFLVNAGTWGATGSECAAQSAHLVSIGSVGEQMAVQGVGANDRWIGLSRMPAQPAIDSSYAWSNGDPRTYSNWSVGEPNGSGTAVRMRADGTWSDTSDTTSFPGICERP